VSTAPDLNLSQDDENSIAGALRSALAARQKYIEGSDDEDEGDNSVWV